MAVLGFYSIFTPLCFWGLFRLARPTWRIPPRAPRVIDPTYVIPKGDWK
jgi:hypothetical protein